MKYQWKNPLNEIEAKEILTLIEDRGNKVLVSSSFTENMLISPTYSYLKKYLKKLGVKI